MGVAFIHATMFFENDPAGWQEAHYLVNSGATLQDAKATLIELIKERVRLCNYPSTKLIGGRVSFDNILRDSLPLGTNDVPSPIATPLPHYPNAPSDVDGTRWMSPHLAWPIDFALANGAGRSVVYISGGNDPPNQTGPNITDTTSFNWYNRMNRYATYLANGDWGAAMRSWPAGEQVPGNSDGISNITFIPASGATPAQFTFLTIIQGRAASYSPGDTIRMWGTRFTTPQTRKRMNGTYIVSAVNVGTGQITVLAPKFKVAPTILEPGWIQNSTQTVVPYTTEYALRPVTHHKRGRPFGAPRGRVGAK